MKTMLSNFFLILATGSGIALFYLAWPFIEKLFYGAACLAVLVLAVGFILTWAFYPRRGVIIHGIHYQDTWKDD